MKILNHIARALNRGTASAAEAYDDAPIASYDWRQPLLAEAARKHGRPFKCAGDDLPREILLGGKELVFIDMEGRLHGSPRPQQHLRESALSRLRGSSVLRMRDENE